MTPFLFVYASLRSGFKSPAYAYITQFFKLVGEAEVDGQFYLLNNIPVAVPSAKGKITGELYALNDNDMFNWAMCQLDDYEGVNVEPGEIPKYRRDLVTSQKDGQPVKAWIYWYNLPTNHLKPLPAEEVTLLLKKLNQ